MPRRTLPASPVEPAGKATPGTPISQGDGGQPGHLRVRKYANRRLYDSTASRHLTHEQLYDLVVAGHEVTVVDATSEEDITNVVLAQLLLERDPLKLAAFPSALLHALIRSNERLLQATVTRHLAAMVESMVNLQSTARLGLRTPLNPLGAKSGIGPVDWMERFFGLPALIASSPAPPVVSEDEAIRDLRADVAALRAELSATREGDTGSKTRKSKSGRAGSPRTTKAKRGSGTVSSDDAAASTSTSGRAGARRRKSR